MLNSETKRKIDSARNILVGNVTNPISQVDQITNALIYKFMDDMDQENIDVDLKPQFFVGDYAKYAWSKLLDKKLSGQERMNLYMQAISEMSKNPHIPQLFRDIFKGAFLPYNDPRVLTLFLKEIDGFSYSHSEELGNAFEYLLSILGSQGDAGQFRTPRHIIDFIAEVVDPKKNETILDPACGTAGFLISAYKHILKQNKEKPLTPDEKTKLMNNIVGYDVSPDMVKLSLVNMYLHGFQSPKIHKYNTLTDEKRWDEQFDVIMANPPFMTPKGGVETHKRFSIQANRAEVLFVDYIMEHLSINGRAGIIVPEGIIFKGDKAYKSLRKKLVEDGLFAVVSLPAGVFQPYSGVKTSILLFDNQVAKQTKEMMFVKIENDGYDLGAQRREIDKNDLPKTIELIQKYKKSLDSKDIYLTGRDVRGNNILLVSKNEITESGDYNLTGDKYRKDPLEYLQNIINIKDIEKSLQPALDSVNNFVKSSAFLQLQENLKKMTEQYQNLLENSQIKKVIALQKKFAEELKKKQKWEMVELGEVCEVKRGLTITKKQAKNGDIPVIAGGQQPAYFHDEANRKAPVITVSASGAYAGFVNLFNQDIYASDCSTIQPIDSEKIDIQFVYRFLKTKQKDIYNLQQGGGQPHVYPKDLAKIKIPLPPLSVQKEIVEQIEVKQNAINHAREIIKSLQRERRYFGQELRKLKDVEMVELGKVCELMTGGTPKSTKQEYYGGDIKWLVSGDIHQKEIFDCRGRITEEGLKNSNAKFLPINSVLIALNGQGKTRGTVAVLRTKATCNQSLVSINPISDKLISEFLFIVLQSKYQEIRDINGEKQRGGLNMPVIRKIKIPLPPLATQKQLVAEAQKEEEIITVNKKLIEIMENKIEKVISEI